MKTLFTTLLAIILLVNVQAQVNRGFAFQSYARNADGSAISEQSVQVKFSINPFGQAASFEETHTVTTDAFGIFSADIGTVNATDFKNLDFQNFDYFLKVEVALQGGSFVTVSNKQLKAVPYAMSSQTAVNSDTAKVADNGVPSGTILPFAGPAANVPEGYLICDGTSYDGNDSKYSSLFSAIGTAWGEDGTKFRVPDLRGYFLRGFDGDAGRDPDKGVRTNLYAGGNTGNKVGSFQTDELKEHDHRLTGNTATDGAHSHTDNSFARADNDDFDGDGLYLGARTEENDWINNGGGANVRSGGSAHSHSIDLTTARVGGNETRSKNAYVLYIIKL